MCARGCPAWPVVAVVVGVFATSCRDSAHGWSYDEHVLDGPTRVNGLVVVDVDGDARADVVALGSAAGGASVFVWRQEVDGTFHVVGEPRPAGPTASSLDAGDIDGDGAVDLVVGRHDDPGFRWFRGAGDGTFRAKDAAPVLPPEREGPPHAHNLRLVDWTGDGRLDVVTAQAELNAIVVCPWRSDGFAPRYSVVADTPDHPYRVWVGDIDGDGKPDVAAPTVVGRTVSVVFGGGDDDRRDLSLRAPPAGLAIGDANHDGHADLLTVGDEATSFVWLAGLGGRRFAESPTTWSVSVPVLSPLFADLDADGRSDVVAASLRSSAIVIRWGDGRTDVVDAGDFDPQIVIAHDIDADGAMDLVFGGWDAPGVRLWLGRERPR